MYLRHFFAQFPRFFLTDLAISVVEFFPPFEQPRGTLLPFAASSSLKPGLIIFEFELAATRAAFLLRFILKRFLAV